MGNNSVLAVVILSLENLDNDVLAAANNAMNGFGRVGNDCMAFKPLRELSLIDENGNPSDGNILTQALSFIITDRYNKGKFI